MENCIQWKENSPHEAKDNFLFLPWMSKFLGVKAKSFPLEGAKRGWKGDKMVKLFHNRISTLLSTLCLNLIKNILFHFSRHTQKMSQSKDYFWGQRYVEKEDLKGLK